MTRDSKSIALELKSCWWHATSTRRYLLDCAEQGDVQVSLSIRIDNGCAEPLAAQDLIHRTT